MSNISDLNLCTFCKGYFKYPCFDQKEADRCFATTGPLPPDRWLKDDGEKQWVRCPHCDSIAVERTVASKLLPSVSLYCEDCEAESMPFNPQKQSF